MIDAIAEMADGLEISAAILRMAVCTILRGVPRETALDATYDHAESVMREWLADLRGRPRKVVLAALALRPLQSMWFPTLPEIHDLMADIELSGLLRHRFRHTGEASEWLNGWRQGGL